MSCSLSASCRLAPLSVCGAKYAHFNKAQKRNTLGGNGCKVDGFGGRGEEGEWRRDRGASFADTVGGGGGKEQARVDGLRGRDLLCKAEDYDGGGREKGMNGSMSRTEKMGV